MLYKSIIENKRVIFVGPSPMLIDQKRGDWIDSFDVVVRTNGASLLLNNLKFRRDYGTRMDILNCNVQFHREMKPLPIPYWVKNYGLKHINFKTTASRFKENYEKYVSIRSLKLLIKELQKIVPTVLMGPIVLTDILNHNPKELYMVGMDFFINKPDMFIPGDYREYIPGYLPKEITKKADVDNIGRIDPHEQYANCKLIYDMYQKGDINTDEEIIEIMEVIMNSPEKYSCAGKRRRTCTAEII